MVNPYAELVKRMREEGKKGVESGVTLGLVKSADPLTLYISGTEIKRDIYAPVGCELAEGDKVAVKRSADINIILAKVSKRT
ncbi:MAG: hypothetical protein ACLRXL_02045 [Christensenellaceae bacterium]